MSVYATCTQMSEEVIRYQISYSWSYKWLRAPYMGAGNQIQLLWKCGRPRLLGSQTRMLNTGC